MEMLTKKNNDLTKYFIEVFLLNECQYRKVEKFIILFLCVTKVMQELILYFMNDGKILVL